MRDASLWLARFSLAAAAALLIASQLVAPGWHAYLSSLPLALGGFAYALFQFYLKPPRAILWKRLLLAGAFVSWAIDQLLDPGPLAVFLGDVVIAAYVLDLFWMMRDQNE